MAIHIDFETRSRVNIWDVGAWEYSRHPSTEVLCIAWAKGDKGPVNLLKRSEINGMPLFGNAVFVAHNAFFENCIWRNVLCRKYGWPVMPRQWRCTMAMANAHALPASLAKCAEALGLDISKNKEGKRVMQKMSKPRIPSKNNPAEWFEDPEDFKKLYEYCRQDVEVEREIYRKLRPLNEKEQKIWRLDQRINFRGVPIDTEAVDASIELAQEYVTGLNKEIKQLTKGQLHGVSSREQVLKYIERQGIEMDRYTKADVAKTLKKKLPPAVRRILEVRQQTGKTSIRKYNSMKMSTSQDGRIRDTLMYHGASTGRWSGKLVQMQNLPKGIPGLDTDECIDIIKERDLDLFEMCYDNVMGALSSCIRGMICAPEGRALYVADFAAIEARVLFWLAYEKYGLNLYHKGEDLYVDMSRRIYNTKSVDGQKRQLGKTAVLGCGYGMGSAKFHATCQAWGIDIPKDLAQKAVRTYRDTYKKVCRFWTALERTALQACRTGKINRVGKLTWGISGDFLFCRLPSGRCIAYPYPKIIKKKTPWGEMKPALSFMGVNSLTRKWERQDTYGGKLCENVTQATARDLLAEAMLRLEESGYPVVLSVHDEIICERSANKGSVEEFIKTMETLPEWAKGCPVSAEGFKTRRYRK